MSEMYWITRIGALGEISSIIAIIGIIIVFAMAIFAPFAREVWNDLDEKGQKIIKKYFAYGVTVWGICAVLALFVPSRKELLLIYGVGSTIDYIKSNDNAKELPDKAIEVLDKYLDSIGKEEE